ncbi:MAG: peptidoglycan-binding domain-containing protein [Candidatus Binataceae bacterium]
MLRSQLFAGDAKLKACLTMDSAHILLGAVGDYVSKIQAALFILDNLSIDAGELIGKKYGPSTARAVLAFKKKRHIINRS